ncbi:uncharacterized protein Z520_03590 [Fonsecaea multimorphosa CBS 102226]|uniref:Uncharacterized protein n=1 Tax=Fonsecaea multimorphosa CBS 102226 TaxID=1442371 RepID=A0A0D2KW21_9EURO|nr:uncharacterized protein Z520_03590 [Fonsecaea multimorphosa CBS 102226]KIY00924.1 hypothetical protein Z520_03590 [Fonsecaea multimorphosa CBS 102226]OAL27509.1 hypothetical protein AYO22_03413 [Fonsecaea multimorphosa]
MAPSHRYDLVKDHDEDTKDEKDLPQHPIPPSSLSWWKILLGVLALLASAGVGATLAIVLGPKASSSNASASASDSAAPAIISTSSASSGTITTSSSADLPLPTRPVDSVVEEKVQDADPLAGQILECGYSPEEARANGCVYDVMMQDWVPEPCYDAVLTERYLAQGNWTWYADAEGTRILSDEEMRKGEHGAAWMSSSYHQAHCIFSWDKTVRALRNNRPISQELLSYDHVLHCSMQTLNGVEVDDSIGVRAPTNYAKCALYDTWKYNWIPDRHSSTTD